MNVGEMNDADSVELAAKSGDGDAELVDFDAAGFPASLVSGAGGGEVQAEIVGITAFKAIEPAAEGMFAGLDEDGREDGAGG